MDQEEVSEDSIKSKGNGYHQQYIARKEGIERVRHYEHTGCNDDHLIKHVSCISIQTLAMFPGIFSE